MADRSQRYGMDPEDMRRVITHIGQPVPARAWPAVPLRLMLLWVLLGLTILLGLVAASEAHAMAGAGIVTTLAGLDGDRGKREPVKKGSGGPQGSWITPLEKLELDQPAASRQLYNFLQIFPVGRAGAQEADVAPAASPRAALVMPKITETTFADEWSKDRPADEPFKLSIALAFFCLIVLWLHLRARGHEADRNWRKKK